MTEKQINNWLRSQFSPIGWVLIADYVLMNAIVSMAMAVDMGKQALWNLRTGNVLTDFDWDTIWCNGWGYIASCVVLILILYGWKGTSYWGSIWHHKERKMTFPTAITVIGMCTGAQLLNGIWVGLVEMFANALGKSMIPLLEEVSGASASSSLFFYGAVAAPLAEELLFRGYILHTLKPYGKRFAILGSAVLFGVIHGNLLQTPYAFVMGLVLGWLAMEHSLRWAIGLHVFNNLILAEGLSYLSRILPPGAADLCSVGILAVFSGAAAVVLLARRREIRAYRRGEWIDRRCVSCFFTSFGIILLLIIMAGNMIRYFLI